MKNILRFNPFNMEDNVILYLNTGREKELEFVLKIIERNVTVKKGTPLQHILLIGPRGSGKSFLLRMLQVHMKSTGLSEFVLLPEEQLNIYQPAHLIKQIKNKFLGKNEAANIPEWTSDDVGKEWEDAVLELEKTLSEKHCSHIVAAVENFDLLLKKDGVFKDNRAAGLLRKFLTEKPWITLIATTLYPDIESRCDYPIYHFFARYELGNWREKDHLSYLEKVLKKTEEDDFYNFSKAKIRALTRFTGGNPRITVIMVDVLAKNRLDSSAEVLEHTIDQLTPFYQDLINRMPNKSKLLFDALIRGGEPCTQSELAQRVGTTQNIISQHFNKLQINGSLFAETVPGKKYKLYSVRDRLFAHFYKMRYIFPKTGTSILTVMSEFLTQFYSSSELRSRAMELYEKGKANNGEERYNMVKQLRDEVIHYYRHNQIAEAYKVGKEILIELSKRKEVIEPVRTLREFFVDLLNEKTDPSLIGDLMDEVLKLFGGDMKFELEAIAGTLEYIKSGEDKKVLMVMEPEKRQVVEALIEELPFK